VARRPDDPVPDPLPRGLSHRPFAGLRKHVDVSAADALVPPPAKPAEPPRPKKAHPALPAAARPAPPSAPLSAPGKKPGPRAAERVTVRRERAGRGGKTVTMAEGPGLAGADLEALAREAARALGVGARVEQRSLVVQGDQAERLQAWLEGRGFGSVARGN